MIGPPDPARLVSLLNLPVNGNLLDAGGGTGRVSSQLLPYVDELVVSDVSAKMLQQAAQKGHCRPTAAHVEYLPFPDDAFDRVLVVDALQTRLERWNNPSPNSRHSNRSPKYRVTHLSPKRALTHLSPKKALIHRSPS